VDRARERLPLRPLLLPSHGQVPQMESLSIRVFWFSKPTYNAGVDVIRMDYVPIRIFSREKTIVD
jgi:hypothetical protein